MGARRGKGKPHNSSAPRFKSGRYGSPPVGTTYVDLPREGGRAAGKIEIVHACAIDPNATLSAVDGQIGKRQQRVAINRNTDALEREYSFGRLSVAAYESGRIYQTILEKANGARSAGCAFEPSSGHGSPDGAIVGALDAAAEAITLKAEVQRVVGETAEKLLVSILLHGNDFRTLGGSPWKGRAIAHSFRAALEALGDHWQKAVGVPKRKKPEI
jgi:hypothetical protein